MNIIDKKIQIYNKTSNDFSAAFTSAFYQIMMFSGDAVFSVDFTEYQVKGNTILFLSPYQHFQWLSDGETKIECLDFHGDFYCIAYHVKEVACNGLLFNNVYLFPHVTVNRATYDEIIVLFKKIESEKITENQFSTAILTTYLQLILALCSKEKNILLTYSQHEDFEGKDHVRFQELLEQYFLKEKSPAFYAAELHLSVSTFSKKIKKQFGKTPTQIIQDRIILESKKMIHLSYKSIKEIAYELNFKDEFYFSRYFKKGVGISPLHFRENVGISIVAK
ncbi:MAG: AraC family transcriptional regulator [Bacteroidota bacterium]